MLYRENGKWALCGVMIQSDFGGVKQSTPAKDRKWHDDFASKWTEYKVISAEPIVWTDEQRARFAEVENMPEDFGDIYAEYVQFGTLESAQKLEDTHSFRVLLLRKSNASLTDYVLDMDLRMMMLESAGL